MILILILIQTVILVQGGQRGAAPRGRQCRAQQRPRRSQTQRTKSISLLRLLRFANHAATSTLSYSRGVPRAACASRSVQRDVLCLAAHQIKKLDQVSKRDDVIRLRRQTRGGETACFASETPPAAMPWDPLAPSNSGSSSLLDLVHFAIVVV